MLTTSERPPHPVCLGPLDTQSLGSLWVSHTQHLYLFDLGTSVYVWLNPQIETISKLSSRVFCSNLLDSDSMPGLGRMSLVLNSDPGCFALNLGIITKCPGLGRKNRAPDPNK